MSVLAVADVQAGQSLPGRTVHIERATLVQYAGASLDRNPIHWDERFARSVGLPDVIAQGMFTMGSAVTVVTVAGAVVPTSEVFEAATTTFSLRRPSSSLVSVSSALARAGTNVA